MKIYLTNQEDPKNTELEVGMLVQVSAVNRNNGDVFFLTDSDEWVGIFKGLNCRWKEQSNGDPILAGNAKGDDDK